METTTVDPVRRVIRVVVALVVVGLLAACGARIDTKLDVKDDGSGARTMVLTLPASDVDALTGGAEALDESIRRHKPAQIEYSGLSAASDGSLSATFVVRFESPAEYVQKVRALLAAGGNESDGLRFSLPRSTFVTGIVIDEDFVSSDLLAWMRAGLVADGVVDQSDEGNMFEAGTTSLVYAGQQIEQYGSIGYQQTTDIGFESVSMRTSITDPETITRTIVYTAAPDKADANAEAYENYVRDAAPEGADVDTPAAGTWAVTFAGDVADISVATRAALGSDDASLSVEEGHAPDDPAILTLSITDIADCVNICTLDSGGAVSDTISVGGGYWLVPDSAAGIGESETGVVELAAADGAELSFLYAAQVSAAAVDMSWGHGGTVSAEVDVVVNNSEVDKVGEGFADLLRPADDIGTLHVERGGEQTTYTVKISAPTMDAFRSRYTSWVPDAFFQTIAAPSGFLRTQHHFAADFGIWSLLGAHTVDGSTTYDVHLPWGHRVVGDLGAYDEPASISNGVFGLSGADFHTTRPGPGSPDWMIRFDYTSYSTGGLILLGVLALGLVGAVVGGVVFRKRIARWTRHAIGIVKDANRRRKEMLESRPAGTLFAQGLSNEAPPAARPSVLGTAEAIGTWKTTVRGVRPSLLDARPSAPTSPRLRPSLLTLPGADRQRSTRRGVLVGFPAPTGRRAPRVSLLSQWDDSNIT